MTTYDIRCFKCGAKLGEVTFPDDRPYPGDEYYGMLCESCAAEQQEQPSEQP